MRGVGRSAAAIAALWLAPLSAPALGIQVADRGRALVPIVIGVDATAVERTAAGELADHLARMTGASFEVRHEPAGGAAIHVGATRLAEGRGIDVAGLAEEEWIDTLSAVSPDDLRYEDFVACGRRLATKLRDDVGCEVVLALTHMREPNDERLAREAPEFDAVLGGHDHHCVTRAVEPHGVPGTMAAAELAGLRPGTPRRPLRSVPSRVRSTIARALSEAGITGG